MKVTAVQACQALLNPNKKNELKKDLKQTYPLIPEQFLEKAIDVVADALNAHFPAMLQECLQANGSWQNYQKELKSRIVEETLSRIPTPALISPQLSRTVVEFLVDLILDQLLQTLEQDQLDWVLASPTARLEALYQEIETIQRTEMTPLQVALFYVQRHHVRYAVVAAVGLLAVCGGSRRAAILGGIGASIQFVFCNIFLRLFIFAKIWAITLAKNASVTFGKWQFIWAR